MYNLNLENNNGQRLHNHADIRTPQDLDDGVKVNYARFEDLLDNVKVDTAGAGDE